MPIQTQKTRTTEPTTVAVVRSMNDHGAMTVEATASNDTRHVVEYESDEIRATLAQLPAGATVPLELERVGGRGNCWRAVGLRRDR
jgi:hypothetical protein